MFDAGFLAVLLVFSFPILIVWFFYDHREKKRRSEERMMMIRQGIIPPSEEIAPKAAPRSMRSLRNSLLCIGISLGVLAATIVNMYLGDSISNELQLGFSISLICFGTGIGYLAYYLIAQDAEKKERIKESSQERSYPNDAL